MRALAALPLAAVLATAALASPMTTRVNPRLNTQEGGRGPWVEGRPLPALRLPTIDGERTVDLADLRGTKLLLVEFASW